VTAEIAGLKTLVKTLRAAGDDLSDLKDANAKAAALVASAATAAAPRRTGRLAGTGRGNRAAGKAEIIFGGARARYAPVVHWGWPKRRIAPDEFASRAAQRTEPQWVEFYAADIQKIIDNIQGT
jgi:hypothetical protein